MRGALKSERGMTEMMGGPEMSKRSHFWLRLAALAVIAAAAYLPRGAERVAAGTGGVSLESAHEVAHR